MKRTSYHIKDMECTSEEQMVRMGLQSVEGIERLSFDLSKHRLDVFHEGSSEPISEALGALNLGASELERAQDVEVPEEDDHEVDP